MRPQHDDPSMRGPRAGIASDDNGRRIQTDRLLLTPADDSDVDRLMTLDADAVVMRFINGGRPSTRREVGERLRAVDANVFVAVDRVTDDFVGWFSMRRSAPDERELGYRLHRAYWGRGLATEGARALIGVTFDDPSVDRVWAQTMSVNLGSRRVMERCGLTYTRTFFDEWPGGSIEGSEHGDVEYEVRRAAFLAMNQQASADLNRSSSPRDASLGDVRGSTPDCPGPAAGTPPR